MKEDKLRKLIKEMLLLEMSAPLAAPFMALFNVLNTKTHKTTSEDTTTSEVSAIKQIIDDVLFVTYPDVAGDQELHQRMVNTTKEVIYNNIYEKNIETRWRGWSQHVVSQEKFNVDEKTMKNFVEKSDSLEMKLELHDTAVDLFLKEIEDKIFVELNQEKINSLSTNIAKIFTDTNESSFGIDILQSFLGLYGDKAEKTLKDLNIQNEVTEEEFKTIVSNFRAESQLGLEGPIAMGTVIASGKTLARHGKDVLSISRYFPMFMETIGLSALYAAEVWTGLFILFAILTGRKALIRMEAINGFVQATFDVVREVLKEELSKFRETIVEKQGSPTAVIKAVRGIDIDSLQSKLSSFTTDFKNTEYEEDYGPVHSAMLQLYYFFRDSSTLDYDPEKKRVKDLAASSKKVKINGKKIKFDFTTNEFIEAAFGGESRYLSYVSSMCSNFLSGYKNSFIIMASSLDISVAQINMYINGTQKLVDLAAEKEKIETAQRQDETERQQEKEARRKEAEKTKRAAALENIRNINPSEYSTLNDPGSSFPIAIGSGFSGEAYQDDPNVANFETISFKVFSMVDTPYVRKGDVILDNTPGSFDASQTVTFGFGEENEIEIYDIVGEYFNSEANLKSSFNVAKLSPFIGIWRGKEYLIPIK